MLCVMITASYELCHKKSRLTHCMLGNFACFFCRLLIFSKSTFSKNSFRNTIQSGKQLGPKSESQTVVKRLSADDRIKAGFKLGPDSRKK